MSEHTQLHGGYFDIPAGHVATVVTSLQMHQKPELKQLPQPAGIELVPLIGVDLVTYRKLFHKVGNDWLWFSRIMMDDQRLTAILNSDNVQVFVVRDQGEDIGLLELEFTDGECELSFLGLTRAATGKGLGRWVMNQAITHAWSRPVTRFWVHTCSFDHPAALSFYIRSGFSPFAIQVDVKPDPRLSGHLPLDAAPHVPLIRA